jgi:YCII-related domain
MNKYLVLYRAPASSRAQNASASPEQSKAQMDAWMSWAKRTGPALVEMGAPLGPRANLAGKEAEGDLGGFSILTAETLDHAKKLLDGHPHLATPSGSIEVLEMIRLNGM